MYLLAFVATNKRFVRKSVCLAQEASMPSWINMISQLNPGEVTEPVRTPGGFIILKLIENEDPDTLPAVWQALQRPCVPAGIIEAARALGDARLFEPLWDLAWVSDEDPELLESAIEACRWEDPRSTDTLFETALGKDYESAELAILTLQRQGSREVFDRAMKMCSRDEADQRHVGARVLGRLGGPRSSLREQAIGPLSKLLEDSSTDVVASAVQGIHDVAEDKIEEAVEKAKQMAAEAA